MIRRLFRIYRPHLGWLALGTLLGLLTVLANVGLLALSGWFITAMAVAGVTGTTINYFAPAALIRGLAMLRTGGRYAERVITHEATFRLIADLRTWFYRHIEPLAPAALSAYRSGELLSRLQKDIDRLDAVYLRIAMPIIVAAISVLLFTVFMALYDLRLALVNLALLVLGGLLLPLAINRLSQEAGRQQVHLAAELRTQAVDAVQGLPELLAFGADAGQARLFKRTNQEWLEQQDRLQRIQSVADAGLSLLSQIAIWSVLLLGIPLVHAAQLPAPNLAMLALFALAGFEALLPLPAAFGVISETREAAQRLFSVTDMQPPVSEPQTPLDPPQQGDICFRQVSLRYSDGATPALRDVSFRLPVGSRTLLQGASGAGKSSIIQLLLRFYDPSKGQILFDGIDLRQFDSEHWRSRVTLLSQHTQLIAGTVRENLLIAAPHADESELKAACQQAHILDFVESLPQGLDTWLGETGSKVSGGQARRIAIARALLKPSPLLLLDEPTEGLDRKTEQALLADLQRLFEGRTVLLITHRPLPLSGIDQVLTLDQGRLSQ